MEQAAPSSWGQQPRNHGSRSVLWSQAPGEGTAREGGSGGKSQLVIANVANLVQLHGWKRQPRNMPSFLSGVGLCEPLAASKPGARSLHGQMGRGWGVQETGAYLCQGSQELRHPQDEQRQKRWSHQDQGGCKLEGCQAGCGGGASQQQLSPASPFSRGSEGLHPRMPPQLGGQDGISGAGRCVSARRTSALPAVPGHEQSLRAGRSAECACVCLSLRAFAIVPVELCPSAVAPLSSSCERVCAAARERPAGGLGEGALAVPGCLHAWSPAWPSEEVVQSCGSWCREGRRGEETGQGRWRLCAGRECPNQPPARGGTEGRRAPAASGSDVGGGFGTRMGLGAGHLCAKHVCAPCSCLRTDFCAGS